jgi:hypothetical protein
MRSDQLPLPGPRVRGVSCSGVVPVQGLILARSTQDAADKVYVVTKGDYSGARSQLVSLNPATGKPAVLAQLPSSSEETTFSWGGTLVLPGNRVFVIQSGDSTPGVQAYQ